MKKPDSAYDKALKLLGYRRYTSMELRKKLSEKGFPENQVQEALEKLTRMGYLEDNSILHDYSTYLARENFLGRFKIRDKLKKRGFSQAEVENMLKIIESEISYGDSIAYWIEKRLKSRKVSELDTKEKQKLVRFLLGKGFEFSAVANRLKLDNGDFYDSKKL